MSRPRNPRNINHYRLPKNPKVVLPNHREATKPRVTRKAKQKRIPPPPTNYKKGKQ